MEKAGYHVSTFIVDEIIDGEHVIAPKVGQVAYANDLLAMVSNGSKVTINPHPDYKNHFPFTTIPKL
jgi:hypothetical protein